MSTTNPVAALDYISGLCKKEKWGHFYKVVGHGSDPKTDLGPMTQDVKITIVGPAIVVKFQFKEGVADKVLEGVLSIGTKSVDVKVDGNSQSNPRIGVHFPVSPHYGVRMAVSHIFEDASNQRVEYRSDLQLV
jgi:hypothetical protein